MKDVNELVFVPLGGVGEIGMNMAAYGFGPEGDRRWVVVDCGVTFPGPHQPGIELIMADPAFLEDQGDNVLGLVLTHAHEDHYGAVLDLWPAFDKPVYATPFTAAMLAAKRASNDIIENVVIKSMAPGKPFKLGPFTIEAINVTHSIPESNSILISTEVGRVLHTGDWKFDPKPANGVPTNEIRLAELGADQKVPLALICDSTNALKEGDSPSESEVGEELARQIANAPHRVAITTFASNAGRLIAIARATEKAGRQLILSGRSLHRVATIARELGMLEGLARIYDQDVCKQLPRDKVVLLCTGSQGEPRAAMARIAAGTHPAIDLNAGDKVIFSSWAIPGNERAVIEIQNKLIDRGIDIVTRNDALVHVTGHPRRNELRKLYDWTKPEILVPVHGEAAHLTAHAALGREHGIKNVLPARNGDMIKLFPVAEQMPGEVRCGELYLDADILCTPEESGVKGRRRLSFGGMIMVSFALSKTGKIVSGPDFELIGLPELEDAEDNLGLLVEKTITGALRSIPNKRRNNAELVGEAVRRAVRGEVRQHWGRKPNVKVFAHRV